MPLCYAVHLYYEKCFNVISIKSTFFNHQIIMDKIINTRWKKHCELQSKTIWDLSLNSQSTRTAAWAHGGPLSATVCSNQLFLWHLSSICNRTWLAGLHSRLSTWLAGLLSRSHRSDGPTHMLLVLHAFVLFTFGELLCKINNFTQHY